MRARIVDSMLFDERRSSLVWACVDYLEGESDSWLLCFTISFGDDARAVQESMPHQIVATAGSATGTGVLHEGLVGSASDALLEIVAGGVELQSALQRAGESGGCIACFSLCRRRLRLSAGLF